MSDSTSEALDRFSLDLLKALFPTEQEMQLINSLCRTMGVGPAAMIKQAVRRHQSTVAGSVSLVSLAESDQEKGANEFAWETVIAPTFLSCSGRDHHVSLIKISEAPSNSESFVGRFVLLALDRVFEIKDIQLALARRDCAIFDSLEAAQSRYDNTIRSILRRRGITIITAHTEDFLNRFNLVFLFDVKIFPPTLTPQAMAHSVETALSGPNHVIIVRPNEGVLKIYKHNV